VFSPAAVFIASNLGRTTGEHLPDLADGLTFFAGHRQFPFFSNFLFGNGLGRVFNHEMKMTESQHLLAAYVRQGSEDAFRALVTRYLALVHSTAVRLVGGDTHLAEDIAQTVFVDLARKARTLPGDVMLGGWLHRHTCFVAAKTLRSERRRQARERQSVKMNALHSESDLHLMAPILDEAINQLGAADRTAILLRYFEQCDFSAVGAALASNEDAARMRVNRALEKLQVILKHRGVTLSAAALGTALAAGAVKAAPAGLAITISNAALVGTAMGTGTTLALLKFMTMTNLKLGLGALVLAGAATVWVAQHQAQIQLRAENQSLRQQMARLETENERLARQPRPALLRAPHQPAPPLRVTAATNILAGDLPPASLYARFKDKAPQLTTAQIEAYLKANGRNASSLLAAYRTSGDPALLKEAMEKYPTDPQVAFEAAMDKSLSPAEQRQWLTAFEQSAPNNALPNYLSALNYFNSGQIDQGVQELSAASEKPQFQDYTLDRWKNDQEAYLSAGYTAAEAGYLSMSHLALPQLAPLKQLGQDLVDLANAYTQAGDPASAQSALQMDLNLGQRYLASSPGEAMLDQLVGIAIQRTALGTMDPGSPYGDAGQTVQDQLNQLAQQRAGMKGLGQQVESLMNTMSDQDWVNYTDRWMIFGEFSANQWLVTKYGPT
jgi:RNA polymerase sigma factor (sigma-70 family)